MNRITFGNCILTGEIIDMNQLICSLLQNSTEYHTQ